MLFRGGAIFLVSLALGHAVNSQNGNRITSLANRLSMENSSEDESPYPSHKPIFFDITHRDSPNTPNNGEDMAGICFFGEMPSASCKLKCLRERKTALCDGTRCYCREMQDENVLDTNKDDYDDSNEHAEIAIIPVFNPVPAGMCYLGEYPSITCRVHCWMRGQTTSCDGYNYCWCQDGDYPDRNNTGPAVVQQNNPQSDNKHDEDHKEDNKSKPGFVLYIIHLLTPGNNTEPQGHETDLHKGNFLWTIPYILALVILALLLILVALECVFFCTRRRSFIKHNIQNILSPPVLEKVNINGKV